MVRPVEVTLLSQEDIESAAPPRGEILRIVEETYCMMARAEAEVPTKMGVHPDHPGSFCHAMPAWVRPAGALGMKWVAYYPGNLARGLPDSTGIIALNDPVTGMPVALMEGMWITYARTAACAAVAAKFLCNPDPARLALIGCGGLGRWSLLMLSEVFPTLGEVRVASRSPESRREFCGRMASQGPWSLLPVDRLEEAVRGADIVVSSIPQGPNPPLREQWWSSGALAIPLDVTAAWDAESFARADRLVTDGYEAVARAAARQEPALVLPRQYVDLAQVVLGVSPGRLNEAERIMAIPSGVATTDMTLAWEIFRRARRAGAGTPFRLT